eukprot:scaffold5149_cov71-Phaeocystis_antarctica.AAC.2
MYERNGRRAGEVRLSRPPSAARRSPAPEVRRPHYARQLDPRAGAPRHALRHLHLLALERARRARPQARLRPDRARHLPRAGHCDTPLDCFGRPPPRQQQQSEALQARHAAGRPLRRVRRRRRLRSTALLCAGARPHRRQHGGALPAARARARPAALGAPRHRALAPAPLGRCGRAAELAEARRRRAGVRRLPDCRARQQRRRRRRDGRRRRRWRRDGRRASARAGLPAPVRPRCRHVHNPNPNPSPNPSPSPSPNPNPNPSPSPNPPNPNPNPNQVPPRSSSRRLALAATPLTSCVVCTMPRPRARDSPSPSPSP